MKRILCVDDHEDTCTMLEVYLTRAGYEIASTTNAGECLRLAQSGNFDLFLLDLWLKDEDGLELCRKIREIAPETPIVIYSADARRETQETLDEINIQAYLVKPHGLDELAETVKRLTP